MKTLVRAAVLYSTLGLAVNAQSIPELVAQGRGLLAQQDPANAQLRFEAVLAQAPDNAAANVLLAATRLLTLAQTPAGEVLLDKLGFDATGRRVHNWRSDVPRDAEGRPVAPTGVSASELSAFVRDTLIPAIAASAANLARIVNTDFTLLLTTADTGLAPVTLDYGDVQMLRALCHLGEFLGYTVHSWNVDVELTTVREYILDGQRTVEEMLRNHPGFLEYATTNELFSAQTAFLAAADRYFAASTFIRARPQETIRLFNCDLDMASAESEFRTTLSELVDSVSAPVVLTTLTNLTVCLGAHFAGQTEPRPLLPLIVGNKPLLGSLPDPTFGGMIGGLTRIDVEQFLARILDVGMPLTASFLPSPRRYELHFQTLPEHAYAVELSSDLVNWTEVAAFVATSDWSTYTDTGVEGSRMRFYRIVDFSEDLLRVAGRVVDRCSGAPVPNAIVSSSLDESTALTDASGRFSLHSRAAGSFEFRLAAQAAGYDRPRDCWFWVGRDLDDVVLEIPSQTVAGIPLNDDFARRVALSGSAPTGSGTTCGATREPDEHPSGGGTVWWSWTAPFTARASVWAHAPGDCFAPPGVAVYIGATIDTLTAITPSSVGYAGFVAVAGETYHIAFSADGAGAGQFEFEVETWSTELTLKTPTDGMEFVAPAAIPIEATFSSPVGTLKEARISADDTLLAVITNSPIAFLWSNVPQGDYWIEVEATDTDGRSDWDCARIVVRPTNDDFAQRAPLLGTDLLVAADNDTATRELNEPSHAGLPFKESSLWWTWTASASGPVTVAASGADRHSANAIALGIYTGTSLGALSVVASNAFGTPYGSQATFAASPGTTYQIAVDGSSGGPLRLTLAMSALPVVTLTSPTDGQAFIEAHPIALQAQASDPDGTIQAVAFYLNDRIVGTDVEAPYVFTLSAPTKPDEYVVRASALDSQGLVSYSKEVRIQVWPPPPANDHFTGRAVIATVPMTVSGHNYGASKESGEPAHAGQPGGASVWWTWTAPANAMVYIDTTESSFDTLLAVYTGTTVSGLTLVAADNDSGGNLASRVAFSAVEGTVYQIAVDGMAGDHGDIVLFLQTDPSITEALDRSGLVWTTGGHAPWSGQTVVTHDGKDAAQSGTIEHDQQSWLQTTVVGPGALTFWWRISSEEDYDCLRFSVNGLEWAAISGSVGWQWRTFSIDSGTHTLLWSYTKDEIETAGQDRAWLDEVSWSGSP
ncbi:MAG TPA: Ig-like domain-containing protein [Verrucomicrobiota bacterium]|nr:Ig-like domain-containing protein [Verrucomicrobiota bacterium]